MVTNCVLSWILLSFGSGSSLRSRSKFKAKVGVWVNVKVQGQGHMYDLVHIKHLQKRRSALFPHSNFLSWKALTCNYYTTNPTERSSIIHRASLSSARWVFGRVGLCRATVEYVERSTGQIRRAPSSIVEWWTEFECEKMWSYFTQGGLKPHFFALKLRRALDNAQRRSIWPVERLTYSTTAWQNPTLPSARQTCSMDTRRALGGISGVGHIYNVIWHYHDHVNNNW